MSSDVAIAMQGVGKRYHLGVSTGIGRYRTMNARTTIGESIAERLRHPVRKSKPPSEFWALRDIDLELREGEVLGLLGRNGAGKTTLLKLLARITSLTEGKVDLYGRVGSLLEVGTGFNLELTGRENIFLNGAILGMRRKEIEKEFDAIVDFSGIEDFLNTPAKRYSTGMGIRLAFSVAAHLRTEILLVDEVLSVGDQAFREKCLGKLGDVAGSGRTVIYVSHLMETVTQLCTQAILLEGGRLKMHASVDEVVKAYIARNSEPTDLLADVDRRHGDGSYRLIEVTPTAGTYDSNEDKVIDFIFERRHDSYKFEVGVIANFVDARENVVAQVDSRQVRQAFQPGDRHQGRLILRTPWLRPGRYRVDFALMRPAGYIDDVPAACFIEVAERSPYAGVVGHQANLGVLSPTLADFSFEQYDEQGRLRDEGTGGTGSPTRAP